MGNQISDWAKAKLDVRLECGEYTRLYVGTFSFSSFWNRLEGWIRTRAETCVGHVGHVGHLTRELHRRRLLKIENTQYDVIPIDAKAKLDHHCFDISARMFPAYLTDHRSISNMESFKVYWNSFCLHKRAKTTLSQRLTMVIQIANTKR